MATNATRLENCSAGPVFSPLQTYFRLCGNLPITLVGIATNILNVCVFRHRDMRNSLVNWFLLAITGSDLALLLSNTWLILFPVIVETTQWMTFLPLYPYIVQQTYPLALIAQTSGVYQTVLASLHRYLGVCQPFRAQRWVTRGPVRLAIFVAVVFSILVNIPRWMEIRILHCYHFEHQTEIQVVRMTAFASNPDYFLIYKVCIYTFVMFLCPFIILITVNCRMVLALRNSQSLRRRTGSYRIPSAGGRQHSTERANDQLPQNNGSVSSRRAVVKQSVRLLRRASRRRSAPVSRASVKSTSTLDGARERGITMMLVAVVVMFLVCNSLAFINNILDIFFHYKSSQIARVYYTYFNAFVEIGNILVAVNSSATILIYLTFSSKYRVICYQLLCGRAPGRKKSATQRATFKRGLIELQNPGQLMDSVETYESLEMDPLRQSRLGAPRGNGILRHSWNTRHTDCSRQHSLQVRQESLGDQAKSLPAITPILI